MSDNSITIILNCQKHFSNSFQINKGKQEQETCSKPNQNFPNSQPVPISFHKHLSTFVGTNDEQPHRSYGLQLGRLQPLHCFLAYRRTGVDGMIVTWSTVNYRVQFLTQAYDLYLDQPGIIPIIFLYIFSNLTTSLIPTFLIISFGQKLDPTVRSQNLSRNVKIFFFSF